MKPYLIMTIFCILWDTAIQANSCLEAKAKADVKTWEFREKISDNLYMISPSECGSELPTAFLVTTKKVLKEVTNPVGPNDLMRSWKTIKAERLKVKRIYPDYEANHGDDSDEILAQKYGSTTFQRYTEE